MFKISAEKVAAVLSEVPGTLRALTRERNGWQTRALQAEEELSKIAEEKRVEKLAHEIERRGDSSRSHDDWVEFLHKKASEGRLAVIEEALDLSPHGPPLGALASLGSRAATDSAEEWKRFVETGEM